MDERYAHILSFCLSHPWAITREMLQVIAGVLAQRMSGAKASSEDLSATLVNRKTLPQPRAGSVSIIPVHGVIMPRANLMTDFSGGTTFEKLTTQLRGSMADTGIKTIVLDVDSPGGSVAGCAEFAAEVRAARATKPIIAQAQYTMASAAYYIASAATEVVTAPSARVGSIGVFMMHDDLSEALKQAGITRTLIASGVGKTDGHPSVPLSEAARARFQAMVDRAYDEFVAAVVTGRGAGMTADRVKNEWQSYVYGAAEALDLGMVDRIATLDQTLTRILSASPNPEDQRAALALMSPVGTDQEPRHAATSQDLTAFNEFERQLLELSLAQLR